MESKDHGELSDEIKYDEVSDVINLLYWREKCCDVHRERFQGG